MSTRVWLTVTLILWLVVTVARQVFDLIGKLWIPVGFNLLQILCCITGLFGVCQMRKFLLLALSISTVISIGQNTLVFLWYIGIFGDISRPVLSAGLPYSYSFFLRHTPYCGSRFDIHKGKWMQSACPLPYNQIEAAQALLHVLLASITLILSVFVILQRKKVKDRPKLPLPPQYAQIRRSPQQLHVSSSTNNNSNAYTNSYDDRTVVNVVENRIKPCSYERHNRNKRARIRPNQASRSNHEQYSSVKAMNSTNDDVRPNETKNSQFHTTGRFQKSSDQQRQITPHQESKSWECKNDKDFGRLPSGTLTSLISFDPKSRTLLRVRKHRECDDDDADGYTRITKINVDNGDYETTRNRAIPPSEDRLYSPSSLMLTESRVKNASQDSVPSAMAPVLFKNDLVQERNCDISSSDSGIPRSSSDWTVGYSSCGRDQEDHLKGSETSGPSSFVYDEHLRPREYISNFRVETKNHNKAVGHYHSMKEFQLTTTSPVPNVPVITAAGLFV